jgi:hypothetical protein
MDGASTRMGKKGKTLTSLVGKLEAKETAART